MRRPEQIPGLGDIQIDAYYKSFLKNLDASDARLSDFEVDFVASNLGRINPLTGPQVDVVRRMMDKHSKVYPSFAHYNTKEAAEKFVQNWG